MTLTRRLAVAFTGYYDHENGVVPEPTTDSLLWAEDFLAIVARAGLALVEAPPDHQCDGEESWCWPCEYRERRRDPSQTSAGVDAVPEERAPEVSAQSAATDAGRAAPARGPYPSSAIPSDGA